VVKEIILPRLDIDMDKGMVVEWAKKEGDEVKEGELIATIMSEKVTYELHSPATGTLYKIIVQPNVEVPVGQIIAIIKEPEDRAEDLDEAVRRAEESLAGVVEVRAEAKAEAVAEAKPAEAKVEAAPTGRIKISPLARRLAREYGIDITKVKGTGPGGRIVKEDILRAVEEMKARPPAAPEAVEVIQLTGIRKISAERLAQSFKTAPHAFLRMDVDMSNIVRFRNVLEKEIGVRPSYNTLLIKAVAKALRKHPNLNATLEGEDKVRLLKDVNICLAVATEEGLVTPVVHHADEKSIAEIESDVRRLVEKAREGRLEADDLKGGTFTITNLGIFGVDAFMAIINPPQAAILAVGRIADRAVVVDGKVEARPVATLTLSFDHRIVDGAPAAQFLAYIKELLEEPARLLI